jgi:hypothetical protein
MGNSSKPAPLGVANASGRSPAAGRANIQMPLGLLHKIVDLLSNIDLSGYDCSIVFDYDDVMDAIAEKLHAVELRKAYSKVVFAKDEDKRFDARIEYLRLKNATSR